MTEEEMQATVKKHQEENEKLKANLATYQSDDKDLEALQKRIQDTEAKTVALENENKRLVMEREKETVLKDFPSAAKFPEFLTGKNKEELTAQAKSIHERVVAEKAAAGAEKEKELAAAWGRVTPGPSGMSMKETDLDKHLEEAKKSHDVLAMMKNKMVRLGQKFRPA